MNKNLGLKELIAVAVGGMVGGGIFTILGISVSMVGFLAPFAIALGGVVALFAAYSYVKLGVYYRDEGATYAFFKRTYPDSHLAASFIGWYTIFGYISTLALYAYTFSSYGISGSEWAHSDWVRKGVAIAIIWVFAGINILTVASVTFVAYEGFQLVINAVNEMENPERNIPRAIYGAVFLVALIYFVIALAAVVAIPAHDLIHDKEYALASGAEAIMGSFGRDLVILGAVLATSSAISGTMFGSSRQMARIADDGYLPPALSHRNGTIPAYAILAMAATASILILVGGLRLILEFGSITFLLVSLLMAVANFKIRRATGSSTLFTLIAITGLGIGSILILWYEYKTKPEQMLFILILYGVLSIGAWGYSRIAGREKLRDMV